MEAVKNTKNMKEVQAEFNFDPTKVTRQSRCHTASSSFRSTNTMGMTAKSGLTDFAREELQKVPAQEPKKAEV